MNAKGKIALGTLVSDLTMAGDLTTRPGSHIAMFIGEHPCKKDGGEIRQIKHNSGHMPLAPDVVAQHSFPNKPPQGYADYYEKMSRYIEIICAPAKIRLSSENSHPHGVNLNVGNLRETGNLTAPTPAAALAELRSSVTFFPTGRSGSF